MNKTTAAILLGSLLVGHAAQAQEWYETMKLKGDLRYRYENIDDETKDTEQQRDRIRARLGLTAKANKETDVTIQFTTSGTDSPGNGDPVSGNQTEGGSGSKKSVYLDLGFIDYHPVALQGLDVLAGKMNSPFLSVADNIWDGDYTPEGLALKYHVGDEIEFLANADYTWLDERAADSDDGKQFGLQAALKFNKDEDNYVLAGASYYGTDNLEGNRVLDNQGKNRSFGNSVSKDAATNSLYTMEYNVAEGFAEAGANIGVPAKVYASYSQNQDADNDDTGYLLGLQLGRAKDPGQFEAGYNYRDLESDAVLAAITDSDSGGGGTNHKGHKVFVRYQALKNLQLSATYFMDKKDPDGKDTDYNRLQVDAVAKF